MQTTTPSTPAAPSPAAAIQERYAARVKARLERPEISVTDARDGILDCFIATYFQGVQLGLRSLAAIEGGDAEVARVTAAMFRRRLREHGTSFEAPTVAALALVKDEVDAELHVTELPAELRGVHDQVCTLLLAKADGALPHRAGRSAVEAGGTATTAVATAPRPLPPPPAPPQPPPLAAAGSATAGPAATELRRVLERHLARVGADAAAGAPAAAVRKGLAQAEALLVALDAFA